MFSAIQFRRILMMGSNRKCWNVCKCPQNNCLSIKTTTGDQTDLMLSCTAKESFRHSVDNTLISSGKVGWNRSVLLLTITLCYFLSLVSSTNIELSMLSSTVGFNMAGSASGNRLGVSVSRAGDVNGDGVDDILIGGNSAIAFPGETSGGIVYAVFGNRTAGSLPNLAMSNFETGIGSGFRIRGRSGMLLGTKTSPAGDIDADGYDDFMVSAPGTTSSTDRLNGGVTYVLFGRNVISAINAFYDFDMDSFTTGADGFRIFGAVAGDQSGTGLSRAGDVNGDGVDDILVGAVQAKYADRTGGGVVYVIFGKIRVGGVTAFTSDVDLLNMPFATGYRMYGAYTLDETGRAVSSAGDLNGDGLDDIIIGVPQAVFGKTYIIYGHTVSENIDLQDAPGAGLGFTITGVNSDYKLGHSVSALGDVNGDGLSDVIVGAPYTDLPNSNVQAGMCVVLFGRNVTAGAVAFTNINLGNWITNSTNGFRIFGSQVGGFLGFTVGGGGDINGDGMNDILVGAHGMNGGTGFQVGAVFVVYGRRRTVAPFSDVQVSNIMSGVTKGLVIYGAAMSDWLSAYAVDFAGDVNNDGVVDLIVGAYKAAPSGQLEAGMGYVIYGLPPEPTSQPSRQPTSQPSRQPSRQPTSQPSKQPSTQPSVQPSRQPSCQPSRQPSTQPSTRPSAKPTQQPSAQPTQQPSAQPTQQPLMRPSSQPSSQPSHQPSRQPTTHPSSSPSGQPSAQPTRRPSRQPSLQPTAQPTILPSSQPTCQSSGQPSALPSSQPSAYPSAGPTSTPSGQPSTQPTSQPIATPTGQPIMHPTGQPSHTPSAQPSSLPSCQPYAIPSRQPTTVPSLQPSSQPSGQPTRQPSVQPSALPSSRPSVSPCSQPSSQPTSQPTSQPSSQPSAQPSVHPITLSSSTIPPTPQPSVLPSPPPSVQPTHQPMVNPTIVVITQPSGAPNGEWAVTLDSVGATQTLQRVGGDLWVCSANTGICTTVGAQLGTISAEYAASWETTIHVASDSASGGVLMSGHTVSGLSTESIVARCGTESSKQLQCTVYTFMAVSWVAAAANTDFNKIVHIGRTASSAATSVTILDTSTISADSYTYTSHALKETTLLTVQNIPNFVGSVLAGTCVTNTAVPQNCIYIGWVRVDTGAIDTMYLTPITGTIRTTVALVSSIAVESIGPDSFIVGGLELNDGAGMHAYLTRVNTLYRAVKYGMRYRIRAASSTSSGSRRTLTEASALRSAVTTTLLLNNKLYILIDYTNSNNISCVAALNINAANGGIVKQMHLSATDANLHCSDITASGLYMAIACTATDRNSSHAVLLSVNKDLSFTKLPVGWIKHTTYAATAESVPFRATVLTMSTKRTPVTMTTHQQVISDERPVAPTATPSVAPTVEPSSQPSSAPSGQPSSSPTAAPSVSPQPTSQPSSSGPTNTYRPTVKPTQRPSNAPSKVPTLSPSVSPSITPTARPTVKPSTKPSVHPSVPPSVVPSRAPMVAPTQVPANKPTKRPISLRSRVPTCVPTTLNHTEYLDPVEDNGRNGTVIAVATAGAVVGGGLLLIFFCTWCQYRGVQKRKKRKTAKAAKVGETSTIETNAAAEADNHSDWSVNLSSLHSSERSNLSEMSELCQYDSPSQLSREESEMSWELSLNSSNLFCSVHNGSDLSESYAD